MSPRQGVAGQACPRPYRNPCCSHLLLAPSAWAGPAGGRACPLGPDPSSPPTQLRWVGLEMQVRDSTHLCKQHIPVSPSNPSSTLPPINLLKQGPSLTSLASRMCPLPTLPSHWGPSHPWRPGLSYSPEDTGTGWAPPDPRGRHTSFPLFMPFRFPEVPFLPSSSPCSS